jgi:CubicO group peptidase (beta-lactamase class C family)
LCQRSRTRRTFRFAPFIINTNTVLLGLIASNSDTATAGQVFQDRVLTPLGLKDTVFPAITSNAIPDPHPQGYMYGTNVETMGSPPALSPDMQTAARAGTLKPNDCTDDNPSWGWAAGRPAAGRCAAARWAARRRRKCSTPRCRKSAYERPADNPITDGALMT